MTITQYIITCTFLIFSNINLDVSLFSSTLIYSLFHVNFSINNRDCFGLYCFRLHLLFQHIRPLFLRIAISTGKILIFRYYVFSRLIFRSPNKKPLSSIILLYYEYRIATNGFRNWQRFFDLSIQSINNRCVQIK